MISTLKKAAIEAGKILRDNFGGKYEISSKIVLSGKIFPDIIFYLKKQVS